MYTFLLSCIYMDDILNLNVIRFIFKPSLWYGLYFFIRIGPAYFMVSPQKWCHPGRSV